MKVTVKCPICDGECVKLFEKTLSINKDILFSCPNCKIEIPVRIFKSKYEKWKK